MNDIFGLGIGADSKSNIPIKSDVQASFYFIASTSSVANSVRFVQREGTGGYSLGTAGTLSISIQADDGTGKPSGVNLSGTTTITPGNHSDWEEYSDVSFGTKPALTFGQKYHLVFTNPSATNWFSINTLYNFSDLTPAQPRWTDAEFGTLHNENSSGWVHTSELPVFDLTYANGTHDGQSVYEAIVGNPGTISGNNMVRETFGGPTAVFDVDTVYIRLQRTSGSSPLTVTLETFVDPGIGALLASGTVPSASIPVVLPPYSSGGGVWVAVALSSKVTLNTTSKYSLRLSCPSDTTYTAFPLRTGDDTWSGNGKGFLSWSFKSYNDGQWGQKTTDASAWVGLYEYAQQDLQFYFPRFSAAVASSFSGWGMPA